MSMLILLFSSFICEISLHVLDGLTFVIPRGWILMTFLWSTDFSNRHQQVKAFMYRHLLIYHNIFRCIYTVIHCPQRMNPCDLGASVTFPLISPFVVLREFIPTAIAMKFWKFMIPRGWLMGTLVTFLTPPASQNVHVQVFSEISKNLNFCFSGQKRKCLFS